MNFKKEEQKLYSRIVRAIFETAETMGIAEREALEQLSRQVIERLRRRPLPGLEEFVPEAKIFRFSDAEIEHIAKEVISEELKRKKPSRRITLVSPEIPSEEEIKLTPTAKAVLERRYLKKDEKGRVIETPKELFQRVARHIASAERIYDPDADVEKWEREFFRLMANLEFLPNSPTLMNAGRELGQLSACFVIPIEDSMDSIFDAVKYTALIHKSGGGTGFSFSRLRPESDRVGSTGGVASGPVSFMRVFDTATDVIKQGGMRRGANMAILRVDHPDILKFITAKEDPRAFTNFNLSVAVPDEFMEKVERGEDYDLINPRTGEAVGRLNAKEVFDKIVEMAWKTGDPGLVFIDRINRDNPTPHLGQIESTNPCGEQPLLPFESCNLGSINLSKMLKEENGRFVIDWEKLRKTVWVAVRFLDNVIDVNKYPLPQIEEMTKKTRKIGLGVMGFADMLIKMGVPYDSEEALRIAEEVMEFIDTEALKASESLAEERGVFPAFKGSIYDRPGGPKVRNATRTTIAPTGTLSIIAGCSSGIEPLFAIAFVRHILEGEHFIEVNPLFEEIAKKEGFWSEELMKKVAEKGSIQDMEEIPPHIRRLFVTAHDIAPEWHVRMQAAFQKHTNNAVSKTVNLPHHATKEDVARVFFQAFREGCKGITVFRDRCREDQVLSVGLKGKEERAAPAEEKLVPRPRPRTTRGVTERVTTGCGNLYVTVNFDDKGPCEVFSSLGKAGGCASAQLEAMCRLISLALRAGVDAKAIVKHLRGIRCPSIAWDEGQAVLSCADAIGMVLQKYTQSQTLPLSEKPSRNQNQEAEIEEAFQGNLAGQCPDCGSILVYQEGCFICHSCGYTKCG